MISSIRKVWATSSSRHWSPLTTVIPRTSVSGDWTSARVERRSVVAGPRQSWSMITGRRAWASAAPAMSAEANSAPEKMGGFMDTSRVRG